MDFSLLCFAMKCSNEEKDKKMLVKSKAVMMDYLESFTLIVIQKLLFNWRWRRIPTQMQFWGIEVMSDVCRGGKFHRFQMSRSPLMILRNEDV